MGARDGITGAAKTGVIAQFKQYDAVTARTGNKLFQTENSFLKTTSIHRFKH